MSDEAAERRLAAILSADVVGYSRLMAEDETATVAAITAYRAQVESLVRECRGRVVDFTGDNFLTEFPTATDAVRCAVEIQRFAKLRNESAAAGGRMDFRIGVHLGEIRIEGERIYGSGVNLAARLQGMAETGGICISGTVHEQVRRVPALAFQDLGTRQLKNIPDPVRVFRVGRGDAARPAPAEHDASVAVLPFVNMSADPDQEFFADGMAEELINALAQIRGLRVIARTSAFGFKGTNADVRAIGEKLAVSAIVEGSVRKAGTRVRITAQLVDVAGGHHLWSQVYDRALDDVFAIQDEIARAIVTIIKPKLLGESGAPLVARATQSQEAYELFLRAADRIWRFQHSDTRAAIEMLEDATRIDPGYADAWARLALACTQMNQTFEPEDRGWHERAERAVHRAFELDANNADAHLARGRMLWSPAAAFQHRRALHALQEALALQPGSHQARVWQSVILMHIGLLDEAREGLAAALAAEPGDAFTLTIISEAAAYQGRLEESQEYMDRAMASDSTLWTNHMFNPVISVYRDDFGRAERALRTARQLLGDDPVVDANEALLWAKRGEVRRAEDALSRATARKRSVGHFHHTLHHAAAALAVLGRPAEAIARLREAAASGLPNYPAFRNDPHLVSLRDEPEMKRLMADLERGCAEYRREFGRA